MCKCDNHRSMATLSRVWSYQAIYIAHCLYFQQKWCFSALFVIKFTTLDQITPTTQSHNILQVHQKQKKNNLHITYASWLLKNGCQDIVLGYCGSCEVSQNFHKSRKQQNLWSKKWLPKIKPPVFGNEWVIKQ